MQKSLRVESLQVNTTNNSKQPQWAAIVGASKGVEVQTAGVKKGSEWLLESSKMRMKPKSELQHKKNKTRGSGQRHEDVKLKEPKERLFASKGRVRKWPAKIAKKETAAKESWPTLGSTIPNQTVEKSIGPMWSKAIRDGDVKAVPAVKKVVKAEGAAKEIVAPYVAQKMTWAKVVKVTEPVKTTKESESAAASPKNLVHKHSVSNGKELQDASLKGKSNLQSVATGVTNPARTCTAADTNEADKEFFLPSDFTFFKDLLSEKNHKTYLPVDFFKFKEWTSEDESLSYLPKDFYKYPEWVSENVNAVFYPKDFYKYQDWIGEDDNAIFFPTDFYKYKEWTTEENSICFFPKDFFKYQDWTEFGYASFLPCDFFKYKDWVREKEESSFLPCDFFKYKEWTSEKHTKSFLPCDFFKYQDWTNKKKDSIFLPSDFFTYKEWVSEKVCSSFLPCDFFKYKEWTNEKDDSSCLPCAFFKYKEWTSEKKRPTFLPRDFFNMWKLERGNVRTTQKKELQFSPEQITSVLPCPEFGFDLIFYKKPAALEVVGAQRICSW
ncbi:hypothetical protein ACI3LY_004101 [Candidozyma auris]|uniref:Uncharacterized protein n=2 Tax=Candidozyma auris TaxID=498019 RepID=A0A2H1A333_CANAR|nr:hypothetical protein QG37_06446 [[Candida] auris]PIS56922.1 hypothetical protein B9J08_001468 [[Candida] auris]QWW23832.1 hypothetical protein CA7LBN_002666 [[Candida] auris]